MLIINRFCNIHTIDVDGEINVTSQNSYYAYSYDNNSTLSAGGSINFIADATQLWLCIYKLR